MDLSEKRDVKGCLNGEESNTPLLNGISEEEEEEECESELLLPKRKGCLSKKLVGKGKPKGKVQWNDKNGKKLTEVLEFQPSDASDSDDEDSESCFCTIM